MAFADYSAYKTATACPAQQIDFVIDQSGATRDLMLPNDQWIRTIVPGAGVAPSTAVVPTGSTAGALDFVNGASGRVVIPSVMLNGASFNPASFLLCDRLSHQGGLSGTVTTAQTTNLPTAALTRYTSGVGVMAALSIYSSIGTTATTFTVSYTNSAGTSGRISPETRISGTNSYQASTVLPIPLAEGDIGVKSVESVTVTATTGAAGNFGVVLYKPLYVLSMMARDTQNLGTIMGAGVCGGLEELVDNACLFFITCTYSKTDLNGTLFFTEC